MKCPETVEQYTQRIMANAEGQDPIKVQSTTPKKLARLIKGIPPAQLRKRPAPEKWSVAEILAHLADVEIAVGWRMRSILRKSRHARSSLRPKCLGDRRPL